MKYAVWQRSNKIHDSGVDAHGPWPLLCYFNPKDLPCFCGRLYIYHYKAVSLPRRMLSRCSPECRVTLE